jgi:DNA-binding XRE family transcriptional regulator
MYGLNDKWGQKYLAGQFHVNDNSPGFKLRRYRLKRNLGQKHMAGLLGVTQAAISQAECGTRPKMAARLWKNLISGNVVG